MSETLNINQDVEDAFYRYKMPKPQFKIEGRGNGIKTVILNINEISRALSRSPVYITKFIGSELGAQTITNVEEGKYLVKGNHSYSKMVEVLYSFILKFVLCPECENPETRLHVANENLFRLCSACGKKTEIKNTERLIAYILKNPPTDSLPEIGNAATKGHLEHLPNPDRPVGLQETESTIGTTAQIRRKFTQDELEILDEFGKYVEDNNLDNTEILQYINDNGIPLEDAVFVLAQIFFHNIMEDRKDLFLKLCSHSQPAQLALLGAFERNISQMDLTGNEFENAVKNTLLKMFEEDLVGEETIFKWHSRPTPEIHVSRKIDKKIKEISTPFIEWLKTAEEESGDDE